MSQQQVDLERELEKFRTQVNRLSRNELVNTYVKLYCENVRMGQIIEIMKQDLQALEPKTGENHEVV